MGYVINREAFLVVEGLGMIACFFGCVLITLSGTTDPDATNDDALESDFIRRHSVSFIRVVGVSVMLFVAFNDATLAVLARKMHEIHFSLLMFWFSALGLIFIIGYLIINSMIDDDYPTFFYYDFDQFKNLALTGIFSALNLTCLVIAYQNDKSSTVSILAYIELVYALLADVLIFD